MSALSFALIFALTTVLLAEFVNGWTDAPNVIAVVVSTGVMSPKTAILMAVLMNTAGAMSGTAVATTVGKSHALLAGLAGAAFAGGGLQALEWAGWAKVLIGMVLSLLLGGVASFGIGLLVVFVAGASKPARTKGLFDRLSVVAACFLAFNHGLNDGQKFMGVFATTLLTGGAVATFQIPFWVILLCALTMAVGTSAGGWRIIRTIGLRMTRLESWQGFVAQAAAGCTIFGASAFGVPLSTTHTITSAIVGVAASRRTSDIRWIVLKRILLAWLITFPACFVAAFAAARLVNFLF